VLCGASQVMEPGCGQSQRESLLSSVRTETASSRSEGVASVDAHSSGSTVFTRRGSTTFNVNTLDEADSRGSSLAEGEGSLAPHPGAGSHDHEVEDPVASWHADISARERCGIVRMAPAHTESSTEAEERCLGSSPSQPMSTLRHEQMMSGGSGALPIDTPVNDAREAAAIHRAIALAFEGPEPQASTTAFDSDISRLCSCSRANPSKRLLSH
jgi:hypothetical protein